MPRVETVLVSSTKAYEATGPDGSIVTVKNLGPDSCVFATASTVSAGSNDGTLTSGSSLAFAPSKFFLSSGTSNLQVTAAVGDPFRQYDKDNGQAGVLVPNIAGFGNTSVTVTASRAMLVRFRPSRAMSITSISYALATPAGSNDEVDVGIYNAAYARLVSSGATLAKLNGSTGATSVTVAATALQANTTYYAAMSTGTIGTSGAAVAMTSITGGMSAMFGTGAGVIDATFMAAAHPLPATITSGGAIASVPYLALRES